MEREAKAAAAAASKDAESRAELTALRSENERLKREIEAVKEASEANKQAAVLRATQKMAENMLNRYKDGLRDGASLSRGGMSVNLTSSTPDSAAAAGSSPSVFSM